MKRGNLSSAPSKSQKEKVETYEVKRVLILKVNGPITPILGEYIDISLSKARRGDLVLLMINTPGGGVTATRDIVSHILESKVPVIAFVYPPGGHAASAGSFIVLASHKAFMAPGTNIGAAHPIIIGRSNEKKGNDILLKKAKSDLEAWVRSLAELRGRNVSVALRLVSESLSLSPEEALKDGIIDGIADDKEEVLQLLRGSEVNLNGKRYLLRIPEVSTVRFESLEMTPLQKALQLIADPQIAYLLVTIGTYLIIIEIFHFTGGWLLALGLLSLITGLTGLGLLSFNLWGLIILILGIGLIVADLKVASHGILSVAGVIAILLGSLVLFRTENLRIQVPLGPIILIASLFALGVLIVVIIAVRTLRKPPQSGKEAIIGKVGVVKKVKGEELIVKVDGVLWSATLLSSGKHEVREGDKVVVKGYREDLLLEVTPLREEKGK